jgi:hypothetical protein
MAYGKMNRSHRCEQLGHSFSSMTRLSASSNESYSFIFLREVYQPELKKKISKISQPAVNQFALPPVPGAVLLVVSFFAGHSHVPLVHSGTECEMYPQLITSDIVLASLCRNLRVLSPQLTRGGQFSLLSGSLTEFLCSTAVSFFSLWEWISVITWKRLFL